jgi:uncharacterized protein (DUF3084 family)
MGYVTIEDRVDRLEALFGQFMTEMAVLNKRADERHHAAEDRHQAAEERQQAAEERQQAAEDRHQAAEQRHQAAEQAAEDRHQAAELRHQAAEERFARFEQEMRDSKREMDKKWGDLANKLGTIIEDILAPNVHRLAREHFRFESILDSMIRRTRRCPDRPGIESEFDVIVVGPAAVILGEAKSTPSIEYVDAFREKVQTFFDFFPEYRGKRLIPIFGSWAIPDVLVDRLTGHGIYALRMGADTMELANAAALETGGQ